MSRKSLISIALLGFFVLSPASPVYPQPIPSTVQLPSAPLQDRMTTWKMKRKHPDPKYLTTAIPDAELDTKPRIYEYTWSTSKEQVKGTIIWKGSDSWRPDSSAQVDELKADLLDEAKAGGYK